MTPEQIQKFYAVPRLAGAEIPEVNGEFTYQGLRGLGDVPETFFTDAQGKTKTANVLAAVAGVGLLAYAVWHL